MKARMNGMIYLAHPFQAGTHCTHVPYIETGRLHAHSTSSTSTSDARGYGDQKKGDDGISASRVLVGTDGADYGSAGGDTRGHDHRVHPNTTKPAMMGATQYVDTSVCVGASECDVDTTTGVVANKIESNITIDRTRKYTKTPLQGRTGRTREKVERRRGRRPRETPATLLSHSDGSGSSPYTTCISYWLFCECVIEIGECGNWVPLRLVGCTLRMS